MSAPNSKLSTMLAQAGSRRDPATGAISVPIYQTASFSHPALGRSTGFDYSRTSNPTRLALEETLAAADGGARGFAFASGLAALDTLLRLFAPGDRIVVTEDLYGGTFRLFERVFRPLGIDARYVDTADTAAVGRALDDPRVRAVFVETPTNPLLKIADLRALAALTRARGALLIVDNTFLTPCLQRPLDLGADVVANSATKFLAGHNDEVAGALVARTPELVAICASGGIQIATSSGGSRGPGQVVARVRSFTARSTGSSPVGSVTPTIS
jgi:cystathionine gamma-synthase